MGTSTNYNAPPSWSHLKGDVTRTARKGPLTQTKAAALMRGLIASSGGVRAMSRGGGSSGGAGGNGGAARATAQRLAGFVANVRSLGLEEALTREGLGNFAGRSVKEILAALLDRLGGSSSTIDDVDARSAMAELEKELFEDADTPADVEQILSAQADDLEGMLSRYFGHYLYELFCRVFFERLTRAVGDVVSRAFLKDIKDYIASALANRLGQRNVSSVDWAGAEGERLSADIMEDTLVVFAGA